MNTALFLAAMMCGQLPNNPTAEPPVPASLEQKVINYSEMNDLVIIRSNIEMLQKLQSQGVQVDVDGKIMAGLMDRVSQITDGKIKTLEGLMSVTGGNTPPPTTWEKVKGYVTFANTMWVTGAIFAMMAIIWLFGHYLLDFILSVPSWAWEMVLYGTCFGLIYLGKVVSLEFHMLPVVLGSLGLMGCISLTYITHFIGEKSTGRSWRRYYDDDYSSWPFNLHVLALAIMWGFVAITFNSHFIGFISVMALLSALGFMAGCLPGVVYIGFDREDVIPRATFAAWLLLALHTALLTTGTNAPVLDVFRDGMNFMGSFVYFLGVLIMADRWYCVPYRYNHNTGGESELSGWTLYWVMQVFAIASGLSALFLGHVFGMSALLGIGGFFFYLYIIEKYYDLPWKGIGWAWSLLGLGAMLIVGGIYVLPRTIHLIGG